MSKPITREEQFLAAMAGEGTAPKPLTRKEQFMAKSAGQTETAPTPLTRKEGFMDDISVGGSTPTGTISITANGTFDVTNYASANVNVSSSPYEVLRLMITDEVAWGVSHDDYIPYLPDTTWSEFVSSEYNPLIGVELNEGNEIHRFKIVGNYVYASISEDGHNEISTQLIAQIQDEPIAVSPTDKVGIAEYYSAYFGAECLVAGSKIATDKSAKNVENIKVGDVVKSIDPETLEIKTATVKKVKNAFIPHEKMFSNKWYKYSFDDGSYFRITGKHRFFDVDTQKYEWAEDIKIGERVYKMDGTMPKLVSVEKFEERVEYNTFWNENHDPYFVDGFLSGNADTPIPNIKG